MEFLKSNKFQIGNFHARYTTKITHHNREIRPIDQIANDVEELMADLCDFIIEIRKENGDSAIVLEYRILQ